MHTTSKPKMSQELTTTAIIEQLNKTVLCNVAEVIDPLIVLINESKQRDTVITEVMRTLPEYKALIEENARLKDFTINEGVKIEIQEKSTGSRSVSSIDCLLNEYDIPKSQNLVSDVKTVKTNLTVSKEEPQVAELQKKLQTWSEKLEEFGSLVNCENSLYEEFNDLKYEFSRLFDNTSSVPSDTVITVDVGDWTNILNNNAKSIAKLDAVASVIPKEEEQADASEEEADASEEETDASEEETEEQADASEEEADASEEEAEEEAEEQADASEEEEEEQAEEEEEEQEEEHADASEEEEEQEEEHADASEEEEEQAEEHADASEEEEEVEKCSDTVEKVLSEEEEECGTVQYEDEEEEQPEDLEVVEMEDEDGNPLEYLSNNPENGDIFELLEGDEVGKKIGKFVNGDPEFFE